MAFDPLVHHIACLRRENRSVPLRDLLAYQKWVVAQDPAFLAELTKTNRPEEEKTSA
jgi:hypothetical protein